MRGLTHESGSDVIQVWFSLIGPLGLEELWIGPNKKTQILLRTRVFVVLQMNSGAVPFSVNADGLSTN